MSNAADDAAAAIDLRLASAVSDIAGIRVRQVRALKRLGIVTVADLIRHLPTRYEYELDERPIAELQPETLATVVGTVGDTRVAGRPGVARSSRFEANLIDDTGRIMLTWFNGSFLRRQIHPGMHLRVHGKIKQYGGYLQMVNPRWQPVEEAELEKNRAGEDAEPHATPNTGTLPPAASEVKVDGSPAEADDQEEAGVDYASDVDDPSASAEGRFRPVYPATEELSNLQLNNLIDQVLDPVLPQIHDHLDDDYRTRRRLPTLAEAYRIIHRPQSRNEVRQARRRLKFDEWLLLQTGIAMRRYQLRRLSQAWPLKWNEAIDRHILARFPYELTADQNEVINEIRNDLQTATPMNRLLQGDVGSGKTAVAVYAMLLAVASEAQAALMAPTELLAEQHFASVSALLEGSNVRLELVTGALTASQRREVQARVGRGEIDIVIGTHALLYGWLRFHRLALAVIDEQHRFGVHQRANLRAAARRGLDQSENGDSSGGPAAASTGAAAPRLFVSPDADGATDPHAERPRFASGMTDEANAGADVTSDGTSSDTSSEVAPADRIPHMLVMTATPIPRTLSLTLFGDLDISTIRHRPPGRQPIITRVVTPTVAETKVYPYVAERIAQGEQAYIVVPAIEENPEANLIGVDELKSRLEQGPFRAFRLAAVHGRLNRPTREAIMYRFRTGEVDVLVATTVIEVGVDVPNASLMVIENADRFGLSQLHQLRGRVGRGSTKSLCVLVADPTTDDARSRLDALAATDSGFEIAEKDLAIRGMGEVFGSRQSGETPFRLASLPEDLPLLKIARADAAAIVQQDPFLAAPERSLFRARLMKAYGEAFGIGDVG